MTITIILGNSDNRLTQQEWSEFVSEVIGVIPKKHPWDLAPCPVETHFSGGSGIAAPWQNVCVVVVCNEPEIISKLRHDVREVRRKYRQDSVAWIEGKTEFL